MWYEAQTTGQKPSSRAGHAMTRVDNHLYVFGGCRRSSFLNDLFVLNTDTMTWSKSPASANTPKARAYHTLTADSKSKSLFLFGGNDDQNSMSELHVFNVAQQQWWSPNTSGNAPSARIGASSLFVHPDGGEGGGRMVLASHPLTLGYKPAPISKTERVGLFCHTLRTWNRFFLAVGITATERRTFTSMMCMSWILARGIGVLRRPRHYRRHLVLGCRWLWPRTEATWCSAVETRTRTLSRTPGCWAGNSPDSNWCLRRPRTRTQDRWVRVPRRHQLWPICLACLRIQTRTRWNMANPTAKAMRQRKTTRHLRVRSPSEQAELNIWSRCSQFCTVRC